MVRRKHEYNKVIQKFTTEDIHQYLSEAMSLVDNMLSIVCFSQKFLEGSIDDFEYFDSIDELGTLNTSTLDAVAFSRATQNEIVAKYLKETISIKDRLYNNISVVRKSGCFFDEEEASKIEAAARNVITGVIYTIVFDFNVFEFAQAVDAGEAEPVIDESFYMYCNSKGRQPEDLANACLDIFNSFRLKLTWFENFPELEDEFYIVMGPNVIAVQDMELNEVDVRAVVNGELTPEDLLAKYNAEE